MNVLVTGATSKAGVEVAKRLRAAGAKVRTTVHLKSDRSPEAPQGSVAVDFALPESHAPAARVVPARRPARRRSGAGVAPAGRAGRARLGGAVHLPAPQLLHAELPLSIPSSRLTRRRERQLHRRRRRGRGGRLDPLRRRPRAAHVLPHRPKGSADRGSRGAAARRSRPAPHVWARGPGGGLYPAPQELDVGAPAGAVRVLGRRRRGAVCRCDARLPATDRPSSEKLRELRASSSRGAPRLARISRYYLSLIHISEPTRPY